MYSFLILPYIILSYFILRSLLFTTTLLLFRVIIPILNNLNLLFNNNIQLNITLINSVQNNNTKEKTIINIKNTNVNDDDNTEELESLKDDSSTYDDETEDETEDDKNKTEDDKNDTEYDKDETKDETQYETKDETKDKTENKDDKEDKTEIKDDKENKDDNKTKELSLFEKALSCNQKKFHQNNLLKKPEEKSYSFLDYFFTKTNKLKDTNNEDVILVDETI
jgi:hypothetical protein